MKRSFPYILILVLIFPGLACKAITGLPRETPTAAAIQEPTQVLQPPTSVPEAPTETAVPEITAVPTEAQTPPPEEPTLVPLVPTATLGLVSASVIDSVVLAAGTAGGDRHPVNPTTL